MSKVAFKGNQFGSGVFTIESPNGNNDRNLTLPDNDGIIFANNRISSNGNNVTSTAVTQSVLTVDCSAANFFEITPTANGSLSFANMTSGQSGVIKLVNNGYVISADATVRIDSFALSTISSTGVFLINFYTDGSQALITVSNSLTSGA